MKDKIHKAILANATTKIVIAKNDKKEQTLKYLTDILYEYQKGQSYLEQDLSNDELKESERLEMNSDLIEIDSKIKEVEECISWVKKLK